MNESGDVGSRARGDFDVSIHVRAEDIGGHAVDASVALVAHGYHLAARRVLEDPVYPLPGVGEGVGVAQREDSEADADISEAHSRHGVVLLLSSGVPEEDPSAMEPEGGDTR